ncbi:hypothetical protein HYFRA_00005367 [Hymenoscyphus fraxineus]|uniref:Uncharacterized protein n=1 Tax=Hymenoscyphus fraxineus TaxID=746836 RepID=A0A9N9LDJ2_9HELO|nr:hypothetical protein HYFRA_00005367 [Hymenoscyphus fraxineus]
MLLLATTLLSIFALISTSEAGSFSSEIPFLNKHEVQFTLFPVSSFTTYNTTVHTNITVDFTINRPQEITGEPLRTQLSQSIELVAVLGPSTGGPNTNERCHFFTEPNNESRRAFEVGSDRVDIGGGIRPGETIAKVECFLLDDAEERIGTSCLVSDDCT